MFKVINDKSYTFSKQTVYCSRKFFSWILICDISRRIKTKSAKYCVRWSCHGDPTIWFIKHTSNLNLALTSSNMSITRYRFSEQPRLRRLVLNSIRVQIAARLFARETAFSIDRSVERARPIDSDNSLISAQRARACERGRGRRKRDMFINILRQVHTYNWEKRKKIK